jgi:hypothetical protein
MMLPSGVLSTAAETSASAAVTSATSAATAVTAATTWSAFLARPGLVDFESTPVDFMAVEGFNRGICLVVVVHGDKTEAAGASGLAVRDQVYPFHGAMFAKELFELGSVDVVGKISHVDVHYDSLSR